MTVSNFKAARRQNAEQGPFLNTDHFAETVQFRPAGVGQSRAVVAHVAEEDRHPEAGGQYEETDREVIWIKVLRDESCARGGIATIAEGATIVRETDSPGESWTFQGQVRQVTPHSWQLQFGRIRPNRYGRVR